MAFHCEHRPFFMPATVVLLRKGQRRANSPREVVLSPSALLVVDCSPSPFISAFVVVVPDGCACPAMDVDVAEGLLVATLCAERGAEASAVRLMACRLQSRVEEEGRRPQGAGEAEDNSIIPSKSLTDEFAKTAVPSPDLPDEVYRLPWKCLFEYPVETSPWQLCDAAWTPLCQMRLCHNKRVALSLLQVPTRSVYAVRCGLCNHAVKSIRL